jgi:hypothetical protein
MQDRLRVASADGQHGELTPFSDQQPVNLLVFFRWARADLESHAQAQGTLAHITPTRDALQALGRASIIRCPT